ncbi:MAG: hypothetical protein V3U84_11925 [Thiotrichaceae bacterium]
MVNCSGLSIEIQQGSFSEPYRINIMGGDSHGAIEKVALIREGMKFGAAQETPISCVYHQPAIYEEHEPAATPEPKITYKRRSRRVTAGTDRGAGSVTQ